MAFCFVFHLTFWIFYGSVHFAYFLWLSAFSSFSIWLLGFSTVMTFCVFSVFHWTVWIFYGSLHFVHLFSFHVRHFHAENPRVLGFFKNKETRFIICLLRYPKSVYESESGSNTWQVSIFDTLGFTFEPTYVIFHRTSRSITWPDKLNYVTIRTSRASQQVHGNFGITQFPLYLRF